MPKRKRLSSSHDDDEESVTSESSSAAPSTAGIGTRKRRRCGTVSQEQLKQLLDAVLNHKRPDGSFASETFYRLPKRRNNPDYFETVQNPIDMAKIQVNLNTHQYDDLNQLASDIELLVENTKQFYPRSSREYTDAVALWNAFNEHRVTIVPDEPLEKGGKDDEKPEKITLRLGRMNRRGSEPTPLTGDEGSEAGSSAAPRSEASNWTPGEIQPWRYHTKIPNHTHALPYGTAFLTAGPWTSEGQPASPSTSPLQRPTSASSASTASGVCKPSPPPSPGGRDCATPSPPPPPLSPPPILTPPRKVRAGEAPPKLKKETETGAVAGTEETARQASELVRVKRQSEESGEKCDEQEAACLGLPWPWDVAEGREVSGPGDDRDYTGVVEEELDEVCDLKMNSVAVKSEALTLSSDLNTKTLRALPPACNALASSLLRDNNPKQQSPTKQCKNVTGEEVLTVPPEDAACSPSLDTPFVDVKNDRASSGSEITITDLLKPGQACDSDPLGALPPVSGSEQARPAVSGEVSPVVLYHAMPPPPSPSPAGDMAAPAAPRRRGRPARRHGSGSGGGGTTFTSRGRGRPPSRNVVGPDGNVVLYVVRPPCSAANARDLDALFSANVRLSPKGPGPTHPELEDALEELFTSIGTATDPEGRLLSTWFQLVPHRTGEEAAPGPSRRLSASPKPSGAARSAADSPPPAGTSKLPQYYDVIKQPMDLKMVAQKIQASEYTALSELEADLQLVFRNACTFNEPGSQIYKDAKVLRKLAQTRRAEIEHARLTAAKSSERIRSKRIGGTACLSAELAQLTYDEDEERSSSDSNMSEDNPLWQLYDAVRSYTTPSGFLLSEPFQTLPSRRLYPDYYEEIKNPIALRQIKRKMKDAQYAGIQEMEDDMNLMFENARQYNPPESKLYKDSIRLQKVLQKKVQEMSPDFDEGEEDNSEEDSMPLPPVSARKTPQRREHPVKERCKLLYRAIRDYINDEGRQLSTVFTELPSRKLYPDYYEIIDSPIDLAKIESKIRSDQYDTESEILQDFKLMFNNCRQYNEEGSVIYDDANVLERVLMSKVRELGPLPSQDGVRSKPRVLSRAQLVEKMWTLFNTIRDHKDSTGRQLSLIFVKLPSKLEYPDYFEVIKSPIHLERISQKLKTGTYNTLDEMMADLVLMFDNACKYNEPDSQVYKDALNLHRLALQTKLQLTEDVEEVPDVKTQIQELLTSLFIATYNHQDADGRCFSDSLAELPEHDEVEGQSRERGISMEIIKRRLDRGLYTRLDVFQEDVFAVLDRARRLSKPESQTFEDACEMQMFFISYRDELCRSGTLLSSPALAFSQDDLKTLIAQVKPDVKMDDDESQDAKPATQGDAMSFNQIQYCTGEFVYVEPKDKGVERHIVNIERLWTNAEGQQMMYGCWFFRPEETFHLPTRKFLEKEVFKSDQHIGCPLSQISGKCAVMSVKDYFRLQPEGYAEQDVYVCESRYSSRSKTFKKIKMYQFSSPAQTLRERAVPLEPRRVMSVFKKRVEKHKEELAELEECEMKIRTREVPNVEVDNRSAMDGNTYYEQLNTGLVVLKTGDCVYVKSEHSKQVIAQVDTMWTTSDGAQYFHGPTYLTSAEIASSVQQMFYKQEVFVSLLEDTHPMTFVTGKCCVLDYTDYCSRRPTEVAETDVYVCENLFDESKRQIVPRGGEPKRYTHTEAVLQDEVYHFRRLLVLRKQPLATIQQEASERIKSLFADAVGVSSPAGSKIGDEDSLDGPPASVGSAENISVGTPVSTSKKSKKLKILTGYILYSADIRKKITSNNPSANFGDISRLVGTEWKNLTAAEKASYEERAARMNADSVASLRLETADSPGRSSVVFGASLVGPDVVYDCCWLNCDHQYEDMADLIDHCNSEPGGHVPVYAAPLDEYQCQWRGCNRIKKGAAPFPNAGRLMRHVKEVHIQKNNGRVVAAHERGRNFVARRSGAAGAGGGGSGAGAGQAAGAARPAGPGSAASTPASSVSAAPEPRFVAVPARPQRLLHSEAYIRYIETLQCERPQHQQQGQGGWERQLQATPETTPVPDAARLPSHWLADGLADSTSVVKTLWHLRDYLMKDALGISRAYEGRL